VFGLKVCMYGVPYRGILSDKGTRRHNWPLVQFQFRGRDAFSLHDRSTSVCGGWQEMERVHGPQPSQLNRPSCEYRLSWVLAPSHGCAESACPWSVTLMNALAEIYP
jgi:hypothetical protein